MKLCANDTQHVLVTGGSGFVGLHLVRRLVSAGRIVRAVQHSQNIKTVEGASWLTANLVDCNLEPLVNNVSTVFHLAAIPPKSANSADENLMKMVNVDATRRLAIAAKRAGASRFIFVSSVAACEKSNCTIVNEENGFPISSYGRSKLSAEHAVLELSSEEFAVTVLRPTALFGKYHTGSVQELSRIINRGRYVEIGKGNNHVNFYYIEDFINVLLKIEYSEAAYGEIFIAADEPQRVSDFARVIANHLSRPAQIPSIPIFMGKIVGFVFDVFAGLTGRKMPISLRRVTAMTRDVIYDNQKIRQKLGHGPCVGWSEGLIRTLDWYRDEGLL